MNKKQKQILIGVALLLLLLYFLRKDEGSPEEKADEGNSSENAFNGGGSSGFGSGGDIYTPTGDDSSDSQSQDPTSPILDYKPLGGKGDTSIPLVGDIASGSSGKPSIGKPTQTNVSNVRPSGSIGLASQQRMLRGVPNVSGGGSYFK